uniref:Uncharacterized protein n=1 Tax=Mola mola TaxID=94237 RepID=A0A3Q3WSY5_MOLML
LTATSGVGYGDSNMKVAEAKQDWMRMLIKYEPQNLECKKKTTNYIARCVETPRLLSLVMASVSQVYDVEDFIVLDLDYGTHKKARLEYNKNYYIRKCPYWLKKDVQYERSVLKRAESLLSSPVSCHATSFYPNRAPPLRRKDGDDLHENVDHGEILPNPDGTFQMSVDLNLSSVKPEDWGKYDCLFQSDLALPCPQSLQRHFPLRPIYLCPKASVCIRFQCCIKTETFLNYYLLPSHMYSHLGSLGSLPHTVKDKLAREIKLKNYVADDMHATFIPFPQRTS